MSREVFRSSVYTNRPAYADYDAPEKFQAKVSAVSCRYSKKKAPPEVLEHPERHDYTINFILVDFFGNVKGVEMNYIDFLKSKVAVTG